MTFLADLYMNGCRQMSVYFRAAELKTTWCFSTDRGS